DQDPPHARAHRRSPGQGDRHGRAHLPRSPRAGGALRPGGAGPGRDALAAGNSPAQTGRLYPPTLLTDVSPANIVWREEVFGPVLAATSFRTLEEAIELANNTRYGLAATLY